MDNGWHPDPGSAGSRSAEVDDLASLKTLRDRLEALERAAPSIERLLLDSAERVATGEPAPDLLDQSVDWFAEIREFLADASAVLGSTCQRLADVGPLIADRERQIHDEQRRRDEAEQRRAAEELAAARRALFDEYAAKMRELGGAETDLAPLLLPSPAPGDGVVVPEQRAAPDQDERAAPTAPATEATPPAPASENEPAMPAGPPPAAGAPEPGDVWAEVASLLATGQEGLAWMLAEATGESQARCRGLKFFAAAASCDPASLEANLSGVLPDDVTEGVDESRLFLAACLRFGLTAGYSPLSLPPLVERADVRHEPTRSLIGCAVDAIQRGGRLTTEDGRRHAELLDEWAGIAASARALKQTIGNRTTALHRATQVLHCLVRDQEPLGQALLDIAELAESGPDAALRTDPRLERLHALVARLADGRAVGRLIAAADRSVSSPTQLLKAIHAGPRTRIIESTEQVRQFLDDGLTVFARIRQAGHSTDLSDFDHLRRASAEYVRPAGDLSAGDAALHSVATWIQHEPVVVGTRTLESLRRHTLRMVFDISRDIDGVVDEPVLPHHLDGLIAGRSVASAIEGHLVRGNIIAARDLFDEADPDDIERLDGQCDRAVEALTREHHLAVRNAEAANRRGHPGPGRQRRVVRDRGRLGWPSLGRHNGTPVGHRSRRAVAPRGVSEPRRTAPVARRDPAGDLDRPGAGAAALDRGTPAAAVRRPCGEIRLRSRRPRRPDGRR